VIRPVSNGAAMAAVALGLLAGDVLATAITAQAFAAESCPGRRAPVDVTFQSDFQRVRLDHTKSAAAIHGLFLKSQKDASVTKGGRAVGLTTSRTEFRVETQTETYRRTDGRYCVYLRSVTAHLDQRDTVIYVAREFPRGSCNFNVIYAHEQQHMRIHYRVLQEYAPKVKRALSVVVERINLLVVRSLGEARSAHVDGINDGVTFLLDAMEKERAARNAALDTAENYANEQAKCPTW